MFGFTPRENQTVELLLQGLTSKEIATRLEISPNTVKAFVRLVMVKMGVTTRSGIVGKIFLSPA
jgi:DNA-binding CsgD family transcriptional regulator